MKQGAFSFALGLVVLLGSGGVMAQDRGPMANTRSHPENFGPLGGDLCNTPNVPFGAAPTQVSDTIVVSGAGGTVANLDVDLQVAHTWVGDLTVTLSHNGVSQVLIERPGFPTGAGGCSADDIDVTLSDAGTGSVEFACSPTPPAIGGTLTPAPGTLAAFDGADPNGNWTMTISDDFPASDDGVFQSWCLSFAADDGGFDTGGGTTGGTSTPATNTWGVIVLIALFLGASVFFLRRRGSVNA